MGGDGGQSAYPILVPVKYVDSLMMSVNISVIIELLPSRESGNFYKLILIDKVGGVGREGGNKMTPR